MPRNFSDAGVKASGFLLRFMMLKGGCPIYEIIFKNVDLAGVENN